MQTDLAQELRDVRREMDLSQEGMARRLGVSTSAYIAWEQGRRRPRGLYRKLVDRLLAKKEAA
jgi:DNA-binding transcriptional regulator YiaG